MASPIPLSFASMHKPRKEGRKEVKGRRKAGRKERREGRKGREDRNLLLLAPISHTEHPASYFFP
jgi:hypothetical protein